MMTKTEVEFVKMIRESDDPAKAMVTAIEVISQFIEDRKSQSA